MLAVIQPFQNRTQHQLGLVFSAIANEAVIDVLTIAGAIDLGFAVVVIEFSEVDHFISAVPRHVPINLEHDLVRRWSECHNWKPRTQNYSQRFLSFRTLGVRNPYKIDNPARGNDDRDSSLPLTRKARVSIRSE